jgi:UDP-N-acetylmuramoyl-L-alanyl-D-glutamate--2,6-diaminopimelate ligase
MRHHGENGGRMKFSELLTDQSVTRVVGKFDPSDQEIIGITKDSRSARKGYAFFATEASKPFLQETLDQGTEVVVSDETLSANIPCLIITDNVRLLLARTAARYYGYPSRDLFVTGVTGTNGKTTVTYLAESIVQASGRRAGVLGTISYRYNGHSIKASNTTPESVEIQRTLRGMCDEAVDHAIMEVSSHALDQGRVAGVDFDCAIFTNLTHDHLDYHGDFNSYLQAKSILFNRYLIDSRKQRKFAIVNIDDAAASSFFPAPPVVTRTYSTRRAADASVTSVYEDINGLNIECLLQGAQLRLKSSLVGVFNVSNILAAALFGVAAGFATDVVKSGIESLPGIPGRLERVLNSKGIHAFVDYAHTPDALQRTMETLNRVRTGRLITVFGCGGDRDRTKRPVMGRIAAEMADISIVTSDNPRSEEPMSIIEQVRKGMTGRSAKVVENRRAAIEEALSLARVNDVVLVAGKGHEDYQIIGDVAYPFSDRAVIEECLHVGG